MSGGGKQEQKSPEPEIQNQKLFRFNDDIEAGKYLILIYARKELEDVVKNMMTKKHPEAEHVATDRHFINPLSVVRRRRRQRWCTDFSRSIRKSGLPGLF